MTNLTAIIITRDKKSAKSAADSVSFADEVIISEQTDIVDYSVIRNNLIKKAKHEWILFIDDDEIIATDLQKEMKKAIKSSDFNGYFLRRSDVFLGRTLKHGENASVRIIRLAKRDHGIFTRPVHEIWTVKGRVGNLNSPLLHYPHRSISTFLSKINHYSTLDADYRHKLGARSSLLKLTFYPLFKFIRNYIFKLGFLDGTPGFIMATMMSFHSFQTWTKLYLLQNKS